MNCIRPSERECEIERPHHKACVKFLGAYNLQRNEKERKTYYFFITEFLYNIFLRFNEI